MTSAIVGSAYPGVSKPTLNSRGLAVAQRRRNIRGGELNQINLSRLPVPRWEVVLHNRVRPDQPRSDRSRAPPIEIPRFQSRWHLDIGGIKRLAADIAFRLVHRDPNRDLSVGNGVANIGFRLWLSGARR